MLTIVIPARDEARRLPPTLAAYIDAFGDAGVEILIVVNQSTDGTADLAAEWSGREPMVRHLVFEEALGKGGAVHRGFAEARGDLIGFVDADGATPPEAFGDLVDALAARPEAGGVIASRWLPGSTILTPQPWTRRLASRMFNLAVRLMVGLRYRDTQCGAKLFRAAALRPVLPALRSTGWLFDIELILRLRQAGHDVDEVPTTWRDVDGSRFSMGRNLIPVLRDLWKLRRDVGKQPPHSV